MRVDMEALLPMLRGSELLKRFREIAELEKYTLLTPPYEASDALALIERAQDLLGVRFARSYVRFMQCCDGGLLFTNHIYSLLAPEDAEDDLTAMNLYLREHSLIPEGSAAIGMTGYGAYIVQCASGRSAMGLWDNETEEYIARYGDLCDWLDDMIEEARFLLEEDALPEIDEADVYIADAPEAADREQNEDGEEGEVLYE